jgi:uncharacterized protein YraI
MKPKHYLPFISILALFTLITFLPLSPSIAAETAEGEVVPGDAPCYVISDDPAGVKVRSGPGESYPVVGTLSTDPGTVVATTITGCAGEWLRIEDIWVGRMGMHSIHPSYSDDNPLKLTGWVRGPVLGVWTEDPGVWDESLRDEHNSANLAVVPVYEEPVAGSPVLIRIQYFIDAPIVGCRGDWLKVKYRGIEGWLAPIDQRESGSEYNPY